MFSNQGGVEMIISLGNFSQMETLGVMSEHSVAVVYE